tara:strand:+ start:102 stop:995 length:894 start_codon:yes stop_codon:yes gene_type:complete
MTIKPKPFYAVAVGKKSGIIVNTWDECKELVTGYKGAIYKKFTDAEEAQLFIDTNLNKANNTEVNTDISSKRNKRLADNETKHIIIYTDGSLVRKNNNVYSGYGVYIPSKHFEISRVLEGKKTNNRAELSAIINAITMFKEEDNLQLDIYTDSQYSIGIFGDTGIKYREKNYMKNSTTEYPNADLVKVAVELSDKFLLNFTHINSHTSLEDEHSKGNDRADKLAVRGAVEDYIRRCENLGEFVLTFGKYKNHFIKNIPTSYLSWIISSSSFEELCIKNEDRRLDKEIVIKFMDTLST